MRDAALGVWRLRIAGVTVCVFRVLADTCPVRVSTGAGIDILSEAADGAWRLRMSDAAVCVFSDGAGGVTVCPGTEAVIVIRTLSHDSVDVSASS